MRTLILLIATGLLLVGSSHARTWTSADGSRTFEGDLRNYDSETGMVTVVVGGRAMSFPADRLSADDIAFLKEQSTTAAMASPSEAAAESVVGKRVTKAKLHRLDGERYKRAELDKAPEYYILYYSASW